MRFREKDERGLRPSVAERPKGKTQITIILFVEIVLTPDGRSGAECDFHSVGSAEGVLWHCPKNQRLEEY